MAARVAGVIVGAVIFVVWIYLVGNPHIKTVIGVVLSVAGGYWAFWAIRRRTK